MLLASTFDSSSIADLPAKEVIFGASPAMLNARTKIEKVAERTIPVLLQGESGTGKDILARLLHGQSKRSHRPWVKVSCPAIPESLIESELFGYEKGAFTGAYSTKRGRVELAHLGTLFLDEVGCLQLSVQGKLLQILQDGTFMRLGAQEPRRIDTRLICSTNEDLRRQAQNGRFRLDFLFRINAVMIDLPPLRQRLVDLPVLVDYFLDVHSRAFQQSVKPLSHQFMTLMLRYHWPGNIRQLQNVIRTYVLTGDEESLAEELTPVSATAVLPEIDLTNPVSLKEITKSATQDLERQIIWRVLQMNGWNRAKTAKWLKISYRSLLYKLQDAMTSSPVSHNWRDTGAGR